MQFYVNGIAKWIMFKLILKYQPFLHKYRDHKCFFYALTFACPEELFEH